MGGYTLTIDVDELARGMLFKPNPDAGFPKDDPRYYEAGVCAIDPKPEGKTAYGIKFSKIIKAPVEGLVDFHSGRV